MFIIDSKKIHFGRSPPQDRCSPLVTMTTMKPMSWRPLKIVDSTTFNAQIGPTGGDKGYTAITGMFKTCLEVYIKISFTQIKYQHYNAIMLKLINFFLFL